MIRIIWQPSLQHQGSQCLKTDRFSADDYFVSNIERVDSVTLLRKDKLLTGRDVSWTLRWSSTLYTSSGKKEVFCMEKEGFHLNRKNAVVTLGILKLLELTSKPPTVDNVSHAQRTATILALCIPWNMATTSIYLGSDSRMASRLGPAWTSWVPSLARRRCAVPARRGRRPPCSRCLGSPTTATPLPLYPPSLRPCSIGLVSFHNLQS